MRRLITYHDMGVLLNDILIIGSIGKVIMSCSGDLIFFNFNNFNVNKVL